MSEKWPFSPTRVWSQQGNDTYLVSYYLVSRLAGGLTSEKKSYSVDNERRGGGQMQREKGKPLDT